MGGRTSSSARRVAGASLAVALGLAACASHRDGERHASGEAAPTGDDTVAVRARTTRELGVLVAAPSSSPATLPRTADGRVRITAGDTFELAFALRGASSVEPREHDGVSVYRRALDGADLVHAPLSDGVEDLVFFDRPPKREELVYDLDVARVAGLRLFHGSLELLDAGGAPRVRVEAPWLVDAKARRVTVDVRVEGCAVDTDPRTPWDRPVTPPGARTCQVRLTWGGVTYPVVVDPAWRLGTSGSPRHGHAAITFADGRVLSMGGTLARPGLGNGPIDSGEIYDPITRTWSSAVTLPSARVDFAMALVPSGKALLVGGGGSSRPELVTSAGVVSRSDASLAASAGLRATTLANGKVLVTGGGSGAAALSAQLFDEATDMLVPAGVAPAGSMKAGRSSHTATRLASGKVLLAGGNGTTSAEIYDPATNTFTLTASPMVHARQGHTAALLGDGTVLLAGGGNATSEIYDPAQDKFTASDAASADRTGAEAVVLLSGDVMIAGGDAAGPVATVEIFDARTRTFSAQPSLLFARSRLASARLAQGEVLIFGGLGSNTFSVAATEIWSPGAPGTACSVGDDCRSGACEERVCCSAACVGPCQTCIVGTGACAPVTGKDDPNSCTGADTCDASGACKKKNGQKCAAAAECASAQCVDGTCCDRACDGQCEACDVAGYVGTCAPVAGPPRNGRPLCAAPGTTCGGVCNGLDGVACAYPSAITSCGASCAGDKLTASTCDGRGACVIDAPRGCAGNFVCQDATACKTACAADTDCAEGYRCEGDKCLPIALCEERFVTKGTQRIDCFPYTCEQSGACRVTCASVSDCVAPTVCSLDGQCVDPPPPPETGCAASPARPSGVDAGGLIAALGLLGVCITRRRRAGRTS